MTPKEKKREYDKQYHAKNRARRLEQNAIWRAKNPEQKAASDKAWREANPDRKAATNAEWYRSNKDRYRAIDLKRNYGVTVEQYDAMHTAQSGRCAICGGVNANGKRLAVDHDHETGLIRELLCLSCNLVIGHARDNPETLRAGALYVEKHRAT